MQAFMSAASKYWTFIRIDAALRRKSSEIAEARAFFLAQFPEFASAVKVPESLIQRRLLHWYRNEEAVEDTAKPTLAELCLRCFISTQIEQACIQLEGKFGKNHGFSRYDLFPFVLTDVIVTGGELSSSTYTPLATEILQTFDPRRGSLSTWTSRLVKHHRELNSFLLEQGVYLVTDWAILNDTTPKQLSRIFAEFHQLTTGEIQQASILLESYHAVYRRDRFAARRAGVKGQCPLPSIEQLQQIAQQFQSQANLRLSAEEVMSRLQDVAELLRQYRIYVRVGRRPTESLDEPNISRAADLRIDNISSETDPTEASQRDFLSFYRQQFINCLDQSLEQVISTRLNLLQRQKLDKSQKFIAALHLFHCRGKSMGEIAIAIGLQAQYQVTRLLKLKQFRSDVRQQMLRLLLDSILEQARAYASPEDLQTLDQKIEIALNEEVSQVMQEAEVKHKNNPPTSLFARRLCCYLKDKLKIGN